MKSISTRTGTWSGRMPGLLPGLCMLIMTLASGCGGDGGGSAVPTGDSAAHADGNGHDDGHDHDAEGEHEDGLSRTPAMIREGGITVESATLRRVGSTITAPGRVIP